MFTFADACTVETVVACISSPPALSSGTMVFLLLCDRAFFGTVSIALGSFDMSNTPLHPLSTLYSISLSIENCSDNACSNGCHLFLFFSFRSFNANSTTDRPSLPTGMVVNPCTLLTICTTILARECSLLCFAVFCLYVTTVSIIYIPSSLCCGSSVSTELAVVRSNCGPLLYPISSSSLKFP